MNISKVMKIFLYIGIAFVLFISYIDRSIASNQFFENRKLDTLLIFTGSDWCLPCMRLEKNILNDSIFVQFTLHAIEFIQADFPQKKKLDAIEIERNEKLAELYNPKGIFPYIVVVQNGLGTVIPFRDQQPAALIKSIQDILQGYE
ncbi:MAG: thioredoxin family protein [Bacteroidetes bacterium]|nr:thioredoxin family protein [Bacteroidota bacterium]